MLISEYNSKLNLKIKNSEDLDSVALEFCDNINKAYNKSCKKGKQIKFKQKWFNSALAHKRKQLKAEFRRLLRSNNPVDKKLYRENLTKYSKECLKAKTEHWRQYTTDLTEIKDVARLQKFFEGKISRPIEDRKSVV